MQLYREAPFGWMIEYLSRTYSRMRRSSRDRCLPGDREAGRLIKGPADVIELSS